MTEEAKYRALLLKLVRDLPRVQVQNRLMACTDRDVALSVDGMQEADAGMIVLHRDREHDRKAARPTTIDEHGASAVKSANQPHTHTPHHTPHTHTHTFQQRILRLGKMVPLRQTNTHTHQPTS